VGRRCAPVLELASPVHLDNDFVSSGLRARRGAVSDRRSLKPDDPALSFAKTLKGHKSCPVTMLQTRPHAIHFQRILDSGEGHLRGGPGRTNGGGPAPAKPALAEVTSAPAPAATGQSLPALAERLHRLRDQAEQLARELETLEKEAQKK
jgi:hypothetical protein